MNAKRVCLGSIFELHLTYVLFVLMFLMFFYFQRDIRMKRRRFISAAELERNVQGFLDSLDNQPFLGNNFILQDDVAEDADASEEVDVNTPDDDAGTSVEAPRLNKFRFKDLDAVLDQENMMLYLLNPQKCTGLKIRQGNL